MSGRTEDREMDPVEAIKSSLRNAVTSLKLVLRLEQKEEDGLQKEVEGKEGSIS